MEVTTQTIAHLFDNHYDNFELELYFLWCESVTANTRDFQKVLSSACIKRWFDMELSKRIGEYKDIIKDYPNATDDDCFNLNMRCFYKMFSRSCPSMIKEAIQQDRIAKVPGIKCNPPVLNQCQLN